MGIAASRGLRPAAQTWLASPFAAGSPASPVRRAAKTLACGGDGAGCAISCTTMYSAMRAGAHRLPSESRASRPCRRSPSGSPSLASDAGWGDLHAGHIVSDLGAHRPCRARRTSAPKFAPVLGKRPGHHEAAAGQLHCGVGLVHQAQPVAATQVAEALALREDLARSLCGQGLMASRLSVDPHPLALHSRAAGLSSTSGGGQHQAAVPFDGDLSADAAGCSASSSAGPSRRGLLDKVAASSTRAWLARGQLMEACPVNAS